TIAYKVNGSDQSSTINVTSYNDTEYWTFPNKDFLEAAKHADRTSTLTIAITGTATQAPAQYSFTNPATVTWTEWKEGETLPSNCCWWAASPTATPPIPPVGPSFSELFFHSDNWHGMITWITAATAADKIKYVFPDGTTSFPMTLTPPQSPGSGMNWYYAEP